MKKQDIKGRIATLLIGHTADQLMTKGYTYGLVPLIMLHFGALNGTILNFVLSFLLCLLTMRLYDWAKKDWLGIETLKEIREESHSENLFSRMFSWALRKGDWAVMLVLSVFKDAFYCTVWMRKGAHQYDGMSLRDWKVFMTTLVISTLWESIWVNVGILVVKRVWYLLS